MKLDRPAASRLAVLQNAPVNKWIALSADETQILADGDTFSEVASKVEHLDENDFVLIRVPPDWAPRVL